ncbi:MAG TPA: sulfatase-like hydrolase/transferase [Gaiellaceae bacterium]|nr:sulfatase-like hydrolase/transferase [Gaiellaceae bacterium]
MRLRIAALHLLVLWAFAVAQPLFDLLGKNGEFFAARGSTRWDVVLFAFVLLFVPPAILTGIEALVPQPARAVVHAVVVGTLVGLFVLQGIRGAGWAGWLLVGVAAALGAGAALAYFRLAGVRLVLTVLAPAPVLFLVLFLLNSDASRLTFAGTDNALAAGERARMPVLLVAFDELPINSLLDAHGRIDAARFPNFAALAAGSTWFANTSTVAEGTTHAVPALLTGRFPHADEFPVYTDHRQNLFTLVGGASDLHVVDDETHLCPPKLCPGLEGSFGGRLSGLAEDTGVVYLHQLLPDDLTGGIPSIANGWDNFLRDASSHRDPGKLDPAFVASLRPARRESLWYVHFMLPHSPWTYLPSGHRYAIRQAPGWGADEVWNGNQAAVDQYWQRHLLQLGYADRVLGKLVARLRHTGLYDRALVVVTADHGISFRAGQKRRPLSDANLQDIAYVPLFVKLPHQRRGRIERAPARTIDIVPTIAAASGVRIPWHVDGHSLLGARPAERQVVLVKDGGRRFVVPAPALEARRERALRRQLRLFGSGEPLSSLFAVGPARGRVNHSIEGRPLLARTEAIDRSSNPVQVSGLVPKSAQEIAVVVGGRIVAVSPAADGRFWALVPRSRLGTGTPKIYRLVPGA